MTEAEVREIARDEISSLCGLVLRRSQDANWTRSPIANAAEEHTRSVLAEIFGEALQQFSAVESDPESDADSD